MTTVPAPLLALVAELTGDLGPGQAGVLLAGHPEALPSPPLPATWPSEASVPPTRVLATPAPLDGKLARGSRVSVEGQPFVVQRVSPVGHTTPSHEHLVVWLSHGDSGALAWVVRERRSKRLWLQGWFT